jgi:hypothetical protein
MKIMKRVHTPFKRSLLATGALSILFIAMPSVYAQQSTGGSGLSISPTRAELTIEKGQSDKIEMTLKNLSGVDIIAKAAVNDFESDNNTGNPKVLVNTKTNTSSTIKNFVSGVTDISLKKDEIRVIDIPVHIPSNAVSGAYYGVIRYTALPSNANNQGKNDNVALNASLGEIVLITVPGNISEKVEAQKIGVDKKDHNGSFFVGAPTEGYVSVKNTGNGFSKPFGKITIKNMSGKEVFSYEMNNTDPKSNVLPGATRIFRDNIKNVNSFGRYTISANITYGSGGDILNIKSSFWVVPLWSVIVSGVLILLILLAALLLYRKLVKRNHRHRR